MSPRRSAWLISLAGFVFVVSLLTAPMASAAHHEFGQGQIGGGGDQILDPPGGPGGGEGGDPDEFFLSVGPPDGPSIEADDGHPAGDGTARLDDLPLRLPWWIKFILGWPVL